MRVFDVKVMSCAKSFPDCQTANYVVRAVPGRTIVYCLKTMARCASSAHFAKLSVWPDCTLPVLRVFRAYLNELLFPKGKITVLQGSIASFSGLHGLHLSTYEKTTMGMVWAPSFHNGGLQRPSLWGPPPWLGHLVTCLHRKCSQPCSSTHRGKIGVKPPIWKTMVLCHKH